MGFKNIVVVGGSGFIGREILNGLLEKKHEFGTISSVKREGFPTSDVLKKLEPQGVLIGEANYKDKSSLVKAFTGADVVISAVTHAAVPDQILFIDAAIEAKVKRFFPSEYGADPNLPFIKETPFLAGKVAVREYLLEKAKQGLIEYTSIASGSWIEYLFLAGFFGFNWSERTWHRLGDGGTEFSMISQLDVGRYIAAMLLREPELTKNKDVIIFTVQTTANEVFALLEKVTGEKITIYTETPEEQVALGVPPYLVGVRKMFNDPALREGMNSMVSWKDKFPEVKPLTLEEAVRRGVKLAEEGNLKPFR